MRKLWLALIAVIGLQVPHASAVPVVDFHVTGCCATGALKPLTLTSVQLLTAEESIPSSRR